MLGGMTLDTNIPQIYLTFANHLKFPKHSRITYETDYIIYINIQFL